MLKTCLHIRNEGSSRSFQKLEPEQDRQTHRRDWMHYQLHSWTIISTQLSKAEVYIILTKVTLRRHSTTVDCGSNVVPSTQQVSDVPSLCRQLGGTR